MRMSNRGARVVQLGGARRPLGSPVASAAIAAEAFLPGGLRDFPDAQAKHGS
jgi:hypothetical protein